MCGNHSGAAQGKELYLDCTQHDAEAAVAVEMNERLDTAKVRALDHMRGIGRMEQETRLANGIDIE